MNHLVQQCVLHFGPGVAEDVPPADRDLQWMAGPDIHAQLAEPGPHAPREPDRQSAQRAAEVLEVESLVRLPEPVQQHQIAGPGPLAPKLRRGRRRMLLRGKAEELALRKAAHGPRQPRVEKSDDGLKDWVGRVGVATVQAQHPPGAEAHHDDPIGVGDDPRDAVQAEQAQSGTQAIGRVIGQLVAHSP
jgi:hypothetical protein